jgi:hypothetical protein
MKMFILYLCVVVLDDLIFLDLISKSEFSSVIVVVFHSKMYQNNIYFLFLKNYFWHQRIKMIKNTKKI